MIGAIITDEVFTLNYQQALTLYQSFQNSTTIFYSMQCFKATLLIFGMIKAIQIATEAAGTSFIEVTQKWQIKDWLKFLWVPALLGSYDFIIGFLDQIGLLIDQEYAVTAQNIQSIKMREDITSVDSQEASNWMSSIINMADTLIEFIMDPSLFVLLVVEAIVMFLDWCIFGVVLLERFFLLWILKIFGGFAIASLMLDKFEDWFYKWLKMYIVYFLLIIPFMAVNLFCNIIYKNGMEELPISPMNGRGAYGSIMLIMIVLLKFKLFKSSKEVVKQIFQ